MSSTVHLHLHRCKKVKNHNAVCCPLCPCMMAKHKIIYESEDDNTEDMSKKAQTVPDKEQGTYIIQVEIAYILMSQVSM